MNQTRFDLGYDHQRYCSLEFVLRTNRRLRDRARVRGWWLDLIERIESEEQR